MALSYLYPPEIQFQSRAGVNNTAGFLRVFYTQTDDRAPTYSDFGGTLNEADIVLDADGRAVVIVDDTKTYRLEVYNRNRGLMFTCDPVTAMGGSGGGSVGTKIVSTDGSVNITVSSGGGITVYDLSTVLTQDAAKWGVTNVLRSFTDGDGSWEQMPLVSSVGSAAYSDGWTAECAQAYDLEACIEIQSGSATATSMLDARFDVEVDGVVVKSQYGSLDPTRPMDRVTFGWKGELAEGQVVNGRLFVKTDEAMNIALLGHVMYNAEVDGVVGSGGGGGGNEYYAGQYIEISTGNFISVTGVAPAGNYVYKNEISAQSSLWNTVSGKEDKVNWGLSGNTVTSINGHDLAGGGADYSAGQYIDIAGDVISVTGLQPSGDYAYNSAVSSKVDQSAFDNCCSAMSGAVSSLSSDISAISGAVSGLTGQYVEISAISAQSSIWDSASAIPDKLDESAFTSYTATASQFTGVSTDETLTGIGTVDDPLSVVRMELEFDTSMSTSVNGNTATVGVNSAILSGYQLTADMSGYIPTGESSNYLLTSQSGMFQPSGNYASSSDLTGYVPVSSISAESAVWNSASAVSAKLDESAFTSYTATASQFTGVSTDSTLTGNGTTGTPLSVVRMELNFDSSMATSVNGNTATVGVNGMELVFDTSMATSISAGSAIVGVDTAGITAVVATGFIPTSESSKYMQTSGMSAYAFESSNSAKLDATAQVVTAIGVAAGALSSINGYGLSAGTANSAGTALYDSAGRTLTSMATNAQASSIAAAYAASAVSSVSGDYYPMTSNPSSYLTTLPADLVYSADLSAYQPSGDYLSATESSNYYPMTGNPSAFLVSSILGTGEI